ncbi:MAG: hypothetical protein CO108_04990 [Deltaproteobacteria bacterium CG_4_9_14_3_um_filter_63_12]|nr:MAG: hypothetical protein CO108_04990 [Deltaproteobacteria bacterium CG_4_9_14_3_um_filter_63_12]
MSDRALPEILAPGGDPDSVRAAILAGANAVYVGLDRFNARMRASNIDLVELRKLCTLAHSHGVRIYVTLNVLMSEDELGDAAALGLDALNAGVDALIIQNLGLLAWFHAHVPDAELHASTQLTTHSQTQLELLAQHGVTQVNLARELSLAEIRAFVPRAHALGMKVEVFVHGAYCISFSGQCYLSASMTGLSANRGECIQACRRVFSSPAGQAPVLPLNLKDNNALAHAADLLEVGVDSVKIEGRRKGYFYVHTVVDAWRRRLDELAGGLASPAIARRDAAGSHRASSVPSSAGDLIDTGVDTGVTQVFHRGFSAGYLEGRITPDMFAQASTDQSLRRLGEVMGYTADTRVLRVSDATGLVEGMRAGIFADEDQYVARFVVEAALGQDRFQIRLEHELKGRIQRGQTLWALAEQDAAAVVLERARALALCRRRLDVRVAGRLGAPLVATFHSEAGEVAESRSAMPLACASRNGLDAALLSKQLGRLGETPYALGVLDSTGLEAGLFLPISELNRMRQAAVVQLPGEAMRVWSETSRVEVPAPKKQTVPHSFVGMSRPFQRVLCVTDRLERASALRQLGLGPFVVLELQGPDASEFDREPDAADWLVPLFPSIVFDSMLPEYEAILAKRAWRLVWSEHSGLGAKAAAAGIPWLAGGLLNASNAPSARALRGMGAVGVVAAPELSVAQAAAMGAALGSELLRLVTVFGPVLCMQTRQCLVRSFDDCQVPYTHEGCVRACRAGGRLEQESGHTFHAIKRPGFHSQLWDDRALCAPEAVRPLEEAVDTFVVDLRDPGFRPRSDEDVLFIAGFFARLAGHKEGRPSNEERVRLRKLVGPSFCGGLQPEGGKVSKPRRPR